MPGGKRPKRKGTRAEREVLKEAGLEARRVPPSGSAPCYPGDLAAHLPGLVVVVKARRRFGLEGWLEGRGLLVLRPDRKPPIAVLPLQQLLALLTRVGGGA